MLRNVKALYIDVDLQFLTLRSNVPHCMPSTPRPPRTLRGTLLRVASLTAVAAALAIILGLIFARPKSNPTTRAALTNSGAAVDTPPANLTKIPPSVCEIVAAGPDGNRTLGTGVLVSGGGVLTCLHVIEDSTEPAVRFAAGDIHEVLGVQKIDTSFDLAYLVIRDPPDLPPMFWQPLTTKRAGVTAVGFPTKGPATLSPGRIEMHAAYADLDPEEQAFVSAGKTHFPAGRLWLIHSAPLTQGFSGGPLVANDGTAAGMNVWVNETAHRSFSVDAKTVTRFLASPPLKRELKPAELATQEARTRAKRWQMSGDQLQRVFDQARAMRWHPATQGDYQVLQQLAFGLTIARDDDLLRATGRTAEHVEDLAKASQPVLVALGKERWREFGQLTLINEFASLALDEIGTGLFAFVRIEEVLETTDRQHLVLVQLSGFEEEQIIVQLDRSLHEPEAGEQWVLLGVQQRDRKEYGGNPLPTVVSRVVLKMKADK